MIGLNEQSELLVGLHREREEQMRLLTSQLLLLEANLRSKQGKIDGLLNQRDRIISNQQETICSLEKELDRCRSCVASSADQQQPPVLAHAIRPQSLPLATTPIQHNMKNNRQQQQQETNKTNKTNATTVLLVVDDKTESVSSDRNQPQQVRVLGREQGDESLDDSDSAVVIDDDHRHSPTFAENPQVGFRFNLKLYFIFYFKSFFITRLFSLSLSLHYHFLIITILELIRSIPPHSYSSLSFYRDDEMSYAIKVEEHL